MEKTNVMRILDQKKIPYHHYEYDNSQAYSGTEVADMLGQDPKVVYKTLVTVAKSKKNYVFDFNEVKYWNIDKRLLPKDAILLNFPFKDQYPRLFWSLIILVSTMCCFVFGSFIICLLYTSDAADE